MRASAVLLALVTSGAVIAACGTGGDGDPTTPNTTGPFHTDETFPHWPDAPTPEETPRGPIWLEGITSDTGTEVTSAGECLGFTIKTDEYEFEPGATISLGTLMPDKGVWDVSFVGPQELRVGDPATGGACEWTKLFGPTGAFDLTITSGSNSWKIEDAIKVAPPKIFDLGGIDWTRKWTLDVVTEADANVFERPYDVDIYKVTILDPLDGSHVFSHTEFFPTGAPALVPVIEFWDPDYKASYLSRGGHAVVFPMRGENWVVVKDVLGQGRPDATYELATNRKKGKGTTPSNNCYDVPTLAPADAMYAYYANYDTLTDNFNPDMAEGCRDSIYKNGIRSPGNDGVWRVTVPAGKTLRVTTYDDKIDNVTFLLPVPAMLSGTSGCPRRINTCVAAAGRFGGGNTDAMIYKNITTADQEFFLIHDSATVMTASVGSFLMNVEVFDR